LHRLDPELVAVIGAVEKQVARNTVTDGGGQDTFSDKVFLLSRVEVGLGTEGVTDGEVFTHTTMEYRMLEELSCLTIRLGTGGSFA